MNKKILLIFGLLLFFMSNVSAIVISKDDIAPSTYVIGKYMFTRNVNSNYDGKLTTPRIMLAAKSIYGNQEEDMIIYYKKASGDWIEALNNSNITIPNEFDIEVIDIDGVVDSHLEYQSINVSTDEIGSMTYVIGKYMFTRTPNDNYDGKLSTPRIMLAAKSIEGNDEATMLIYYKNVSGQWIDALTNTSVNIPSTLKITNIDLVSQVEDTTAPVCTFLSSEVLEAGSESELVLRCTDSDSGIATNSLTSSAFDFDNSLTINNISVRNIENGKEYVINITPSLVGTYNFNLKAGSVEDYSGNSNSLVTNNVSAKKTITATFNANGGSGNVASISCTVTTGSSCNIILPNNGFTYENWNFIGWGNTQSETNAIEVGTSVTLSTNKTYYALWEKEVSVVFNANSCTSSSVTSTAKLYNGETTLNIIVPEVTMNSGWTSLGASNDPSSIATGIDIGTTMAITGIGLNETAITRYYNCKKTEQRTLTLLPNGGSGNQITKNCSIYSYNGIDSESNCSVNLPTSNFEYPGWVFNGWSDDDSSTIGLSSGTSVILTEDMIYYATWKKILTVTFNSNNCAVSNQTATVTLYNGEIDATVIVPEVEMNSGWTSLGASNSTTSTTGIPIGSEMLIESIGSSTIDVTKYYNCSKTLTFTATFNANGGSGLSTSKSCDVVSYNGITQGSTCSITLPENAFTYDGWTFNGWATLSSSTSGSAAGTNVTLSANTNYYATWLKVLYIEFNANNCVTSGTTISTAMHNGANNVVVTVPEATMNSGWTSLGVSDSPSSIVMGTQFGKGISITGISSTTNNIVRYYNCSKLQTFTLSLDSNGGNGSTPSRSCNFISYNGGSGSCSVQLPANNFERAGYKFNGWGAASTSTSGVAAGQSITLYSDTTRYVVWKAINYTISLIPIDQLGSSPNRTVKVLADGEEINFNGIYYDDYQICSGSNPTINLHELDGITQVQVELTTSDIVNATISN